LNIQHQSQPVQFRFAITAPCLPLRLLVAIALYVGWQSGGAIPALAADDSQGATLGAELFTGDKVLAIRIEAAPADLESLRKEPREFVSASVQSGQITYSNVAVHLKGRTGSFRGLDDKPALTLDFDRFATAQRFHGLSRIHMNNSVEDSGYLNDALGSELFRKAGVPVARVTHATVEFNGRKLGLYVLKEGFTREFLALHFRRTDGNLYENDPTDDDRAHMKRNSGSGPDDQSDLQALLAATAETDHARRWQRLGEMLDLDQFLTFMAVEIMAGHRDGYCLAANNYRLYFDPGSQRFTFIPHGMDQLFGRADLPLRANMGGPVASAVMETAIGRRLYLERAAMLLTNLFRAEVLTNRLQQLSARIRPALEGGAAREQADAARQLDERIARRLAYLAKQLQEPELKPLAFTDGVARLPVWRAVDAPQGGGMEQAKAPDGKTALRIKAGPTTSASWRVKVLLAAGRYRFEGAAQTAGVKPMAFGKNKGAGLRVSVAKQSTPHQLVGDSAWTKSSIEFVLTAPETEVELLCELRASAGEAWFDFESLRLMRLP
jgi:hypothetical protein